MMDPETFYKDCYGIIHDDCKPQKIRIKVFGPQVNYIRSVPLHDSQIEEEQGKDYHCPAGQDRITGVFSSARVMT